MTSLIIGRGEVGQALQKMIGVQICDLGDSYLFTNTYDILHICFPFSESFSEEVIKYQKQCNPKYTVIHSTVPVGTCRKLNAIHSPIVGKHPFLVEALKTHIKFIGGEQGSLVADYFRRLGFRIQLCDKQETTELAKLLQTEYYRTCIEFTLKAKELCNKHDVPFSEAYTLMNVAENEANIKLGFPEQVRPVLQPIMTPIGGHCLIPNSKLI